jgi:hypothetical protein
MDPFNHELLEEGLEGELDVRLGGDQLDSYTSDEKFPDAGGVTKCHQLHISLFHSLNS